MTRFGRRNYFLLGCTVLGFAVLAVYCAGSLIGARINTSSSLPLGLYVVSRDDSERLIEFCPSEPFASQSSVRGYRTPGFGCPDGAVPLLKPIVAQEGDLVVVSAEGIAVNGRRLPRTAPLAADAAGRPLRPWPMGVYPVERGTVWVASSYNRGSYDSRYMGPVSVSQIRTRLKPLWTLGE